MVINMNLDDEFYKSIRNMPTDLSDKLLLLLKPNEEKVIRDRAFKRLTLREIANEFGKSHERIRQIEHKAMLKIRYRSKTNAS